MVDPELFARYQQALGTNADLTKKAVEELLDKLDGLTQLEQAEYLLANYPKLVRAYGKIAADVARQFYQESRDAHFEGDGEAGEYVAQAAQPIPERWLQEDVGEAIVGNHDMTIRKLPGKASRRAMQRADETIGLNARRDPARGRWAVVPHPGACGWCVMVASNGWAYSERSVNAQRHDHCKCSVAVDFDRDDPSLAGYDPDALRRQYEQGVADAGGEEAIQARWDALPPEERAKYRRKGRSAYDVFRTGEVARAIDARAERVKAYKEHVSSLEASVRKATRGGVKVPAHVWEHRMDELLEVAGLPRDSIHIQHGAELKAHELVLVGRFASDGHDVEVLRASNLPGAHTPDFRIDGVLVEAKRLEAWSIDRLGKKIHEASAQSRDVAIDLSLETVPRSAAVKKAKEVLNKPMYRFLSKYERRNGFSRGKKEIRVNSVTLVFHDRIEVVSR